MNKTIILSWDEETVVVSDDQGEPIAEMPWPGSEDLTDDIRETVSACGLEFVWHGEPEGTANGWQAGVTVR